MDIKINGALSDFRQTLHNLDQFGKTQLHSQNSRVVPIQQSLQQQGNSSFLSLSPSKEEKYVLEKIQLEIINIVKLENKQREYYNKCQLDLQEALEQLAGLKKHVKYYQTAVSYTIADDVQAADASVYSIDRAGGLLSIGEADKQTNVLNVLNILQANKVPPHVVCYLIINVFNFNLLSTQRVNLTITIKS